MEHRIRLIICSIFFGSNYVIFATIFLIKRKSIGMDKDLNIYFMKQALREAEKAFNADEVPIGALIVSENQIIARGYNQTQTLNDSTAHAEIIALTSAFNFFQSKYLPNCTIFVTVEPCVMCAGALKWAQIGGLVYGTSEPKSGFSLYEPNILHPKTTILGGVLEQESVLLMQEFYKKKRG